MGSSVAEIAARLTLNGAQFSSELARQFGAVEAAARDTAARTRTHFETSFNQVQQLAQRALTMPRTQAGALDLNVGAAKAAAAAAHQEALALREVAAAAEAAARKTGDQSESTRLYVQAARAAAMEAERTAKSTLQQANALDVLQAELNQTKSSTDLVIQGNRLLNASQDTVVRGAGGSRMAMVQASQQVQDFAIQVQGGQRVMVAFAQQASQMAFVMQGMGGTVGKVAGILSSPWGAAILLGTMLLGNFIPKLIGASDASEDLGKKLKEQAAQAEATAAAERAFATTLEGVEAALRDNEKALEALNNQGKTAAEIALANARANLAKLETIRAETQATIDQTRAQIELNKARTKVAGMDPRIAGPVLADANAQEGQLRQLEAKLARTERRLAEAETAIGRATRFRLDEIRSVEPDFLKNHRKGKAGADARLPDVTMQEVADILGAPITSGKRSAEHNKRVGGAKNSYHLAGLAIDIPLTVGGRPLSKAGIAGALAEAGVEVKELKGPGDKGHADHFHVAFAKRRLGPDQIEARQEKRDEELKREAEHRERILAQSREQLTIDAESLRFLGLRSTGAEQQAEAEAEIAKLRRESADRMAEMSAAERQAQSLVTDGLDDQIAKLHVQADAMAALLIQHGDREKLTDAERAALEAQRKALEDQLVAAEALAKTEADRLRLREAIARIKVEVAGAGEQGRDEAREREQSRKEAEQEWKAFQKRQAQEARAQFEDLADFYERAFRSGGKSIWKDFKDQGLRVLAQIAAAWTMALLSGQKTSLGGILQQIGAQSGAGGFGGGFNPLAMFGAGGGGGGGLFGGGMMGSFGAPGAIGEGGAIGGIPLPGGGSYGGSGSIAGFGSKAGLGGGAGGFLGSIGGAMGAFGLAVAANQMIGKIFGFKGGPLGILTGPIEKLFKGNKWGRAVLTSATGSPLMEGNSGKGKDAASGAGSAVQEQLQQIAEALGADLGSFFVSIGMRDGDWRVNANRGSLKKKKGAKDFDDDAEGAIAFAVQDAIKDGAITGISAAAQKILQSGQELRKAIEKAVLIESIPKRLKAMLDPVGAAIDELNGKWEKTVAALKEGGATAEQFADAQKLYKLELEAVKASTRAASADLKDFLDSLAFGPNSPYSLRDQEAKARTAVQPFLDKIAAGETVDQAKYVEAAQQFLDIERQLFGSTAQFFEAMDLIQAATGKAIATIDNAVPVRTVADPFHEATASNTATTNELLDQLTGVIREGFASLREGGSGGAFIGGDSRGFQTNPGARVEAF